MRLLAYSWPITLFVLIAGCSLGSPAVKVGEQVNIKSETKMNNESTPMGGVNFKADAKVDGAVLTVNYTVTNTTGREIFLFDQMVGYEGNVPVVSPKTAYAFFEEPDTLRLVRATIRLPLEKEVRVFEIPFARTVEANGVVTGTIEMPVPVPEKSPFYAPPKDDASKEVECREIHLIVGWSEPKPGMNIMPADTAGPGALRIRGAWAAPYQHFLEEKIPVNVKVKVHTDVFDRQMPLQ